MCRDMNECLGNQLELIEEHQKLAYLNHADICSIFIPKRHEAVDESHGGARDLISAGARVKNSLLKFFNRLIPHGGEIINRLGNSLYLLHLISRN